MQYKLLSLAAMAASASAQSLTAALSNQSSLSSLVGFASYIPASLLSATNITVLAPSNAAFAAFLNSSAAAGIATNNASISALLSYHILNGTYYASEIASNATFVPTELNNTAYANVTGGQRVEAILEGSNVTIISGLLQNSTVTTAVCASPILELYRMLTYPEHQLYWWCNPHHRPSPHSPGQHFLHCGSRWP
jgi:uncharacterized surface protein with fasciclin (FAS1) repeats